MTASQHEARAREIALKWCDWLTVAARADVIASAMEEAAAYYEHMLNWQVTCKGCADSLDKSYEAYMSGECDRMRAENAALRARIEAAETWYAESVERVPAMRHVYGEVIRILRGEPAR